MKFICLSLNGAVLCFIRIFMRYFAHFLRTMTVALFEGQGKIWEVFHSYSVDDLADLFTNKAGTDLIHGN